MKGLQGRRVLVTGGSGFVGRNLVPALLEADAEVQVLTRDPDRARALLPAAVQLLDHDLLDHEALAAALQRARVDSIVHLAAQAVTGIARSAPVATLEANVRTVWCVLEAARIAGIERLVTASSDQVYGPGDGTPLTESSPLASRDPYGASKICADLLVETWAATWQLPAAVARFCNLYGPHDLEYSRLVPGTIRAALIGERPLIRSDGSPRIDLLHVADLVDGLLRLLVALADPSFHGRVFNFATGTPRSVLDFTRAILAAADRPDIEPEILGEATAERRNRVIDTQAAQSALGWSCGDFSARIASTVTWYRAQDARSGAEPAAAATTARELG